MRNKVIDLTPSQLYEAIASGPNEEANDQLARNLRRNEWFYILKQVGPQDAEDVFQNAWVIVKEAIQARRIEHGDKLFAYARGVVKHLCVKLNREGIHIISRDQERLAA